MSVGFLTPEQRSRYGVFNAVPDIAQLGAFFHLDVDDRRRAMAANGARNQLGWSLQLGCSQEDVTWTDWRSGRSLPVRRMILF